VSDFETKEKDTFYNIWNADKSTRRYRNELFRTYQILRLAEKLPVKINSLLDVGCGTGKFVVELAKKNRNINITALDMSDYSLSLFEEQARKYSIKQINHDLFSFQTDRVDVLVSQEVIEHIPDVGKTLRKMRTFIKPNGYAIICVPYKENLESKMVTDPVTGERHHSSGHLHSFTKALLKDYVEDSGYKVNKIKLNANKRLVRWFTKLNIAATERTCLFDDLMNFIFPDKAAYVAILCQNIEL